MLDAAAAHKSHRHALHVRPTSGHTLPHQWQTKWTLMTPYRDYPCQAAMLTIAQIVRRHGHLAYYH